MDSWFLIADDEKAVLLVRSLYGPVYEIESWSRGAEPAWAFAERVQARLEPLIEDMRQLAVVAPPAVLELYENLCPRRLAQRVTDLDSRRLRQQLQELCPA